MLQMHFNDRHGFGGCLLQGRGVTPFRISQVQRQCFLVGPDLCLAISLAEARGARALQAVEHLGMARRKLRPRRRDARGDRRSLQFVAEPVWSAMIICAALLMPGSCEICSACWLDRISN